MSILSYTCRHLTNSSTYTFHNLTYCFSFVKVNWKSNVYIKHNLITYPIYGNVQQHCKQILFLNLYENASREHLFFRLQDNENSQLLNCGYILL